MSDLLFILEGVPWTLGVTAVSFVVGALLGLPLCLMSVASSAPPRWIAKNLIMVFRGIPPIVWLFLLFFGLNASLVTMSPFVAACVGLGLITAANMAEIYRGALAAISHGQWEASAALGLPTRSAFGEIIAPQLIRIALPSAATFAIGLLKDSAVASVIGVPEIASQGYRLSQQNFRGIETFGLVALIYIAMSLPIAWMSRSLDLKMRSKVAR